METGIQASVEVGSSSVYPGHASTVNMRSTRAFAMVESYHGIVLAFGRLTVGCTC